MWAPLLSVEGSLSDTSPSMTLSVALAALRQVRVSTQVESRAPVATMMNTAHDAPRHEMDVNKRRMDDINKNDLVFRIWQK